ncbi:MAG TPA: hypothetical protein VFT22_10875 [Kofleriaceae bacterium]|nr:hypothetical protein [Kofleriaceae bacterium]
MALAVSIQQATCNALQLWLSSQLTGVSVEARWPDPEKQFPPGGAVTILLAGGSEEILVDPAVVSVVPSDPADPTHKTFIVRFRYRRQRIQLDVWHTSDVGLDDLIERLDIALNAPESLTMPNTVNSDLTRNGVLLALADGFTGNCDFTFEQPELDMNADRVQQREWRATYRGFVDLMLARTVTSAVLTQIELRQKNHISKDTPLGTDVATIYEILGVITPKYTFDPNS